MFDTSILIFTVNIQNNHRIRIKKIKKNEKLRKFIPREIHFNSQSRKFISRENHLFFHSRK